MGICRWLFGSSDLACDVRAIRAELHVIHRMIKALAEGGTSPEVVARVNAISATMDAETNAIRAAVAANQPDATKSGRR